MKHGLCLILLLLVVCATAKDLRKLKGLGSLAKHGKENEVKKTRDLQQHERIKVTELKCFAAEDIANDPRVLEPKIRMSSAPVTSTAPDAVTEFASWAAMTTPAFFPNIERGSVIEGVKRRLDNPARIQQGSAPVCGPASIIFWLVARRPYTYLKMARALYETGTYTDDVTTSFVVTVTDKHKNAPVGHGMDPVDWIVLVALRVSANAILNVDQFGDLWGVTTPGEMLSWTKNLLSYANAKDTGLLSGDQSAVLTKADKAVNGDNAGDLAEGVASLLIDASAVPGDSTIIAIPNHWIAYVGGLQITDTTISFRAFTWGRLCDITATRDTWQSKGFGVVYGCSPDVNVE